ncbi:MAG: hypothetical protein WCW62_14170 [Bacteroidales bacterium]|jgi:hypothetical protein
MKSGKYIVIPCKPYVKQFLIQNFGYPVNFYSVANPYTYLFRTYLHLPDDPEGQAQVKRGKRPKPKVKPSFTNSELDVPVEFVISDHDFYRYGWEMDPIHITALNTIFEQAAKLFMRTSITIDTAISGSQATSIRRFQDRYGYPDEIWNFQSIKKDLDRNTIRQEIGFDTEIYDKVQKILMHNLYKLGTLSKNNQLSNEYSRKRTKQPRGDSQDLADRCCEDSLLSL